MHVRPQEMETNTHYRKWKTGTSITFSFTYPIGAVALERGVADDERPQRNVDGTAAFLSKTE